MMRGRLALNFLLLILAAGLFAWIWRDMDRPAEPPSLANLDPKSVQSIIVKRIGDQDIYLQRSETGWRVRKPRVVPGSGYHAQLVLEFLQLRATSLYAVAELDLAAVGLAEPRITLSFDGESYAFGTIEPRSKRRYIRHGDTVYLVMEGVSALLSSPWWNFIDRRLIPEGAQVTAVELADGRMLSQPGLLARWQQAGASIVKPMRKGAAGADLYVRLASGERMHWQVAVDDQPRLLRPELGLAYYLSPEAVTALAGGASH